VQKHDLTFAFSRGDLVILRPRQALRQFRQLVIVRCEQRLCRMVCRVVQVLRYCPRDRESIERRRPTTDLIKQHE